MGGLSTIFGLILMVVSVWAFWKIFAKAGYNGALSLLMLIPLVNLAVIIWFALADWPNLASTGLNELINKPPE